MVVRHLPLSQHYQFGYQFVTSCPHYLPIALYSLILLISLVIPQKLDFPMPLTRLYDLYHIACMTFHKIFYELWRIDTIFWILIIHNYWFLHTLFIKFHILYDLIEQKLLYISAFTQKHITINLTWMLVWRNKILRGKKEIYVINIKKIISE